jgi:pimeloyl-ACP methyl ester carboxylesterase
MQTVWVLFIGFSLGLSAHGVAQDFDHHTEPHEFKTRSGVAVETELGTFLVPENRSQAISAKAITLRYIRFPATTISPGPPIVYLAGGPGGAGTDAGRGSRFKMFQALRQLGDVIAFDQRGTGMSDRLPASRHRWQVPVDQPATREVVSQAIKEAVQKSVADWRDANVDLDAYNTRENAHDLEALRLVLGAEKLRLCGISYGTHLGLAYMRFFPESVQSVVLAGVEGLDQTVKLPADQQKLLEQIDAWVKKDPQASQAFPDFLGSVERVLKRLDSEPHVIKRDDKVSYVITKFDIQRLTAGLLRGPQNFRMLPNLYKQMDEGSFSQAIFFISNLRRGSVTAMSAAMDAASGRTKKRAELIRQQAAKTLLGDAINFPYEVVRQNLNVPDLGDKFRAPLVSDIPVLAISGTADGRTPVSNAVEVLSTLSNGSHLIIEGAGHSDPLFLSSPRILQTMLKFYAGEKVGDSRIELEPIKFVLPR